MKNKILTLAITGVIGMLSMSATAQQDKKAAEARKELREAKIDSAADFHKFRKEAEMNISENQKMIVRLKEKKAAGTKEIKRKYDVRVSELEEKNNALRKKIANADDTKTDLWVSFKQGFDREMKALQAAIKSI